MNSLCTQDTPLPRQRLAFFSLAVFGQQSLVASAKVVCLLSQTVWCDWPLRLGCCCSLLFVHSFQSYLRTRVQVDTLCRGQQAPSTGLEWGVCVSFLSKCELPNKISLFRNTDNARPSRQNKFFLVVCLRELGTSQRYVLEAQDFSWNFKRVSRLLIWQISVQTQGLDRETWSGYRGLLQTQRYRVLSLSRQKERMLWVYLEGLKRQGGLFAFAFSYLIIVVISYSSYLITNWWLWWEWGKMTPFYWEVSCLLQRLHPYTTN